MRHSPLVSRPADTRSRFFPIRKAFLLLALFLVALLLPACHPSMNHHAAETGEELRAVWVSVLGPGFQSPEEIDALVDAVRRANLNVIVAQVRRRGAVCFQSDIDPAHPVMSGQPGFDPLAVLLEKAHDTTGGKARIDVQAWFNVYKIDNQDDLKDATPPPVSIAHPDWFTRDAEGETQPALDPALPQVQIHVLSVIEECLRNYDVDGINLDFIRYYGADMGYHPEAVARFQKLYDRDDRPAPDDPQWSDFRRKQITDFVRQCAVRTWSIRPDAIFSVDVVGFGGPDTDFTKTAPYRQVYQDWVGWAEEGCVDWVTRMGYKRERVPEQAEDFREWADLSKDLQQRSNRFVTLGIGGFFNPLEDTLTQYRVALERNLGTCLFSYNRPTREDSEDEAGAAESALWDRLGTDIYPEWTAPPRPLWRGREAVLCGIAYDSNGNPIADARVTLDETGQSTLTAATGFFSFMRLQPGTYQLRLPGSELDGVAIDINRGSLTYVGPPQGADE
jgi:uncharacterized lipoprotein YddW (UPF0748 family)